MKYEITLAIICGLVTGGMLIAMAYYKLYVAYSELQFSYQLREKAIVEAETMRDRLKDRVAAYQVVEQQNQVWRKEHEDLGKNFDQLLEKHKSLEADYLELCDNFNALSKEHAGQLEAFEDLVTKYETLMGQFEEVMTLSDNFASRLQKSEAHDNWRMLEE